MVEKPLAARISEALLRDKRTKNLAVDVSVVGAQVTLTGTVPSASDRKAAEDVARATQGVAGVINEVRIGRLA